MGWWYTLPHPAAPIFTCVLGWTLWLPGLQSEPNLLTTEWGTWGVAAELTRSPSRSHNTDLRRPSSLYQLPDRLSRKGVFLTVFALLYPFLFPLWISIDCASVKKSLFYNFYLNRLQHKMNDYSKFPTKSAKSKWVSFECTNSVYQKSLPQIHSFWIYARGNAISLRKNPCTTVSTSTSHSPNFGVSNESKRRERKGGHSALGNYTCIRGRTLTLKCHR